MSPHTTVVLALGPAEQERLEQRLSGGDFERKHVEHARFSVKGEGVVATLYRSGKLVLQGKEIGLFAQRYLGRSVDEPASVTPAAPLIGSDECGKGDYFGPLVVCALLLEPAQRAGIRAAGVMDSKRMSDEAVLRLAPALEKLCPHALETLDPPEYNREHARLRNLNPMLADLHARAIRRIAKPGMHVLVDQFAKESLVASRLEGSGVELRQMPHAEQELAVAAASVVARAAFLERLAQLSEPYAVDLHKGAGAPTDAAAQTFVEIHGFDKLGLVAKVHFKNTLKLPRSHG